MWTGPAQPRLVSVSFANDDQGDTMSPRFRTPLPIRRLARVWADIDYAQRRLFEIRTGARVTDRRR